MEMQAQIVTPEIQQTTDNALTVIDAAGKVNIVTVHDYQFAQGLMKEVKDRIKALEDVRMSQTRPLDESKRLIMDFFRGPLQKLNDAKEHLNVIMVKWTEEQEARRREEERLLNEVKRKREEEDALARAIEAEEAGEKEEAEQILKEPSTSAPIKLNSEIPKSKESHIRETWSAELVNLEELVHGIANGIAPLQAVQADMTFLNAQARSYKQTLKISGIRAVSRKTQI